MHRLPRTPSPARAPCERAGLLDTVPDVDRCTCAVCADAKTNRTTQFCTSRTRLTGHCSVGSLNTTAVCPTHWYSSALNYSTVLALTHYVYTTAISSPRPTPATYSIQARARSPPHATLAASPACRAATHHTLPRCRLRACLAPLLRTSTVCSCWTNGWLPRTPPPRPRGSHAYRHAGCTGAVAHFPLTALHRLYHLRFTVLPRCTPVHVLRAVLRCQHTFVPL